ncbi:hypothetical protein NDU88_001089 [Pleurodeles waltl]|uniref:Uncharacterized protein n=1 Tax=Pleurodeles waltl TaxID=8319 RepID=A0AAV7WLG5_PLEWA|nr:hypothetical protein NDU88_001089 [Pleurodeles waltl]
MPRSWGSPRCSGCCGGKAAATLCSKNGNGCRYAPESSLWWLPRRKRAAATMWCSKAATTPLNADVRGAVPFTVAAAPRYGGRQSTPPVAV